MKFYPPNQKVFIGASYSKLILHTILMSSFAPFFLSCATSITHAAIVGIGDVNPADPATWTSSTGGSIGQTAAGSITVDGGSRLISGNVHIGLDFDGMVTITGNGSKWTNSGVFSVGNSSHGTLIIEAGGQLINFIGYLGYNYGSIGNAIVTGTGSKWTNSDNLFIGNRGSGTVTVAEGGIITAKTLYTSLSDLLGNGTITTNGVVLDNDLTFDNGHGVHQTILFGTGGSLNLNLDGTADLGAGYRGVGTLLITDGISVKSARGYIGYLAGSNGTATVAGTGSKWTVSNRLYVGYDGSGSLSVIDGGAVTAALLFVGSDDSKGTLTVANGGSVTTQAFCGSLNNLLGNGTITTNGATLDDNIVFDKTHGPQQPIAFGTGGRLYITFIGSGTCGAGYMGVGSLRIADGVTITSSSGSLGLLSGSSGTATITGVGSKWTISQGLYVGSSGTGLLVVEAGGQVNNDIGYLGQGSYSGTASGTAIVTGIGSKWTNTGDLYIGGFIGAGNGTLNVESGGQVSSLSGYLGYTAGSLGTAKITGAGSKWINSNNLYVGKSGNGTLNIMAGGTVAAGSITIKSQSLMAIDVGTGSMLSIGNGNGAITNNGTARILAGASPVANATFLPISARTWSGSGIYQAVGGKWNSSNHSFTVSGVQVGVSGVPVTVDLLSKQRVLIGDSGSGWTLGASFAASDITKLLTLTATAMGDGTLTSLENLVGPGHIVLGAWSLSTDSGYTPGDPAYLSFGVGSGHSSDNLKVWQYVGTTWTPYTANDLNYDSTYASFTVSGFSGYAVTTVPEPSTLALLGMGAFGLLAWAWRRRKA